jgi:hypothetical protein
MKYSKTNNCSKGSKSRKMSKTNEVRMSLGQWGEVRCTVKEGLSWCSNVTASKAVQQTWMGVELVQGEPPAAGSQVALFQDPQMGRAWRAAHIGWWQTSTHPLSGCLSKHTVDPRGWHGAVLGLGTAGLQQECKQVENYCGGAFSDYQQAQVTTINTPLQMVCSFIGTHCKYTTCNMQSLRWSPWCHWLAVDCDGRATVVEVGWQR